MNWLILKNDFKRNKVINFVLFLFMVFSACLASLSSLIAVQTFSSISELYSIAQPPHFLQMHKGDIDEKKIDQFMDNYEAITYKQICKMIDIYGESVTVIKNDISYDLSDCHIDIGMVKQNDTKDLLLNSEHEKATVKEGEIGIPILLKEMYDMELGDKIMISENGITEEFVISEFVLDSMMNSTMCSSTRILLSDKDFALFDGKIGENEYLIESYFTDSNEASNFQTAYEKAGMPQNGQAVTYSMIFLLSALTDLVTVFVLLLVSILLIIISFICVHFTIMSALEEDITEIGTMKAIGLPFSDIRELYMNKYRVLAMTGTVGGYVLALIISSIFMKHLQTTFGNMTISGLAVILSFTISVIIFILLTYYCRSVLKKIKSITVVDALVNGNGFEGNKGRIKDGLYKSKKLPVNMLIGVREVFYKFKNWSIVFAASVITVCMILIPLNIVNTFESPEFITYMGSSLEDIMIEIKNGEKLEESYADVKQVLQNDKDIKNYYEYRSVCVQTEDSEGEEMNLHIECGKNSGNGLRYLDGRSPEKENEIALSSLNADKAGKNTGDIISLTFDGREKEAVISGIYQDITSGGYTAKSKYDFSELAAERYVFTVNLNNSKNVEKKASQWSDTFKNGIVADPMEQFMNQTLGGVVKQLKTVVGLIVLIAVLLEILITALALRLRLAKNKSEIAVLKAIGFSEEDITKQYITKVLSASFIGIMSGIFITKILENKIVDAALSISGLGIKRIELISNPVIEYIGAPLLLIIFTVSITWIVMKITKKYNIVSIINE